MLNLVLHCGARRVSRAQIERSVTPPRTSTWVPIAHDRLLKEVEFALAGMELRTVGEAHALSADGLRYFGLMELANGKAGGDYSLVLGIRNSHDKSFPAALVVGSGVFVCDNLAFSGEIRIARRHTFFIERDLPQMVGRAMGQLADVRRLQDERIGRYKEVTFTDARAHDLVVRALDAQVVPVTRVPAVLEEWRKPRHLEFANGGKTAWRLLNAFTENLKGNIEMLPRRTQALHGLLDGACRLKLSAIPAALT